MLSLYQNNTLGFFFYYSYRKISHDFTFIINNFIFLICLANTLNAEFYGIKNISLLKAAAAAATFLSYYLHKFNAALHPTNPTIKHVFMVRP